MQLISRSTPIASGAHGCDEARLAPTCEILVRGRWTPIPIGEAVGLHPHRLKRCRDCHGAVAIETRAAGRADDRFVHRHPHAGCVRDAAFQGRSTRHPKPLR